MGAPTYEAKLFPPMVYALDMAGRKGIKKRKVFRFGSYGWSGGGGKEFEKAAQELEWEIVGTGEFNGRPTGADIEKCRRSVKDFIENL